MNVPKFIRTVDVTLRLALKKLVQFYCRLKVVFGGRETP